MVQRRDIDLPTSDLSFGRPFYIKSAIAKSLIKLWLRRASRLVESPQQSKQAFSRGTIAPDRLATQNPLRHVLIIEVRADGVMSIFRYTLIMTASETRKLAPRSCWLARRAGVDKSAAADASR
jgi:hypothetical protein